jgi:hypothetical protein
VIEHQRIYGESKKDANDFERNFLKSFDCKEQSQEQLCKPQLSRFQVSKVVSCYHEIMSCRGFIDDNDGHGDDDMTCG